MTQGEIKNKAFRVNILEKGKEGETLCYKLYNEELGEFVMYNCHYNADPSFFPNAQNHINGEVEIKIDGEKFSFLAVLVIYQDNPNYGGLTLRC